MLFSNLKRIKIRKYSSQPAEDYNISNFQSDYPISIENKYRKSYYHDLGKDANFIDKTFLVPIRNKLAELTTTNWLNARFRETAEDPKFFPTEFLKASNSALLKFFNLLQKEIDHKTQEDEPSLEAILTPKLYEKFKLHHHNLVAQDLHLKIDLHDLHNVRKGETFMTFGPLNRVRTTLTKAKIFNDHITPYVMWRHDRENQKWLFHEMTFEYDIDPKLVEIDEDGEIDPPTLKVRSECTRQGAVVGIEVFCDVYFTVTITDLVDKTKEWKKDVKREMCFRFESEHFAQKFKGSLKIADVDNLFASTLLE